MKWLVFASLATLMFAGCLDDDGTISAKEGRDMAADEAADHLTDARLMWVGGLEPFRRLVDDDWTFEVHADAVQADGKAPIWAYAFKNDTHGYGAIVAGALGVLAEAYGPLDEEDLPGIEPIADWRIDSDELPAILRRELDWPAPAANTSTFWSLAADDGEPYWFIEREEGNGTSYGAVINARNGTVMDDDFNGPEAAFKEASAGGYSDSVTIEATVTPFSTESETIYGPHAPAFAELVVNHGPAAGDVAVLVFADGEPMVRCIIGPTLGVGAGGTCVGAVESYPASEWVLMVDSDGGVAADVVARLDVHWLD